MPSIADTLPGGTLLIGSTGDDTIFGLEGNDTIEGLTGRDLIFGGDDRDSLAGNDGRDVVRGDDGDDTLFGNDGNDVLSGDDGDDWLFGGAGNDVLSGDNGNDTLTGGSGLDLFLLRPTVATDSTERHANTSLPSTLDVVVDFEDDVDKFALPDGLTFHDIALAGPTDLNPRTFISLRDTGETLAILPFDHSRTLNASDFVAIDEIEFADTSVAPFQVREDGVAIAEVTLIRNNPSGQTVGVTLTPSDGTATSADYNAAPIAVIFGPDEFEKTVQIPIFDDELVEGTETIALALSAPIGGARLGTRANSELEILDEDIEIEIEDAIVTVDEGPDPAILTFTRRGLLDRTATAVVTFSETDFLPATFPEDFLELALPLRFAVGETETSLEFPLVDDTLLEGLEQLEFTLTNPGEFVHFGDDLGFVVISDLDTEIAFSQDLFGAAENDGFATIEVVRRGNLDRTTSLTLATTDGTAIGGKDYTNTLFSITFEPGESSRSVALPLIDDALVEGSETLNLILASDDDASIGVPPVARVRIRDNDSSDGDDSAVVPPVDPDLPDPTTPLDAIVAFATSDYFTDEDGNTIANITLVRDGDTSQAASVRVELEDGTATAGADYDGTTILANFDVGATLVRIAVPIVDDLRVEASETVNLRLRDPSSGTTLGNRASATLTIAKSDPFVLDFENRDNLSPIADRYLDRGLAFSNNALTISSAHRLVNDSATDEFGGNFETSASGINAMAYGVDDAIVANASEGFESSLRFDYASPFVEHEVAIFSGENATGTVLARATLAQTDPLDFPSAYSVFENRTIAFDGVARSVSFGSQANKLALDNLQFG